MAGLSLAPHARGQFGAIARVRWQLFVHSLSTVRGQMELVSRIALGFLFAIMGLGGAVGLGTGAWSFIAHGRPQYLVLVLWPVFLCWQLFPLMTTAFAAPSLDSSELLRFPLSYRFYLLVRLVYGSLEPATALPALWLLGVAAGVGVAAPRLLLWAVIVFFVFALLNIFLSRMIFAWVERWLARRRTREIVAVIFFLTMMSFQFVGPAVQRLSHRGGSQVVQRIQQLAWLYEALPPGLAASAVAGGVRGAPVASLASFALLGGWALGFLWLLHLRLRAQYHGENLSEAVARIATRAQLQAQPGWHVFGLPGPIAAIFEKELHYLLRSGPMIFNLVMPVFMLLIFRIGGPSGQGRAESFLLRAPNLAFPLGVAYTLMILGGIVYNSFGGDSGGVQMFFAAPVRFRQVVVGKNLAHFAVYLAEIMLVWVMVCLLYRPPALVVTLVTLAGICYAVPLDFALGNLLSVYSPTKVEYGKFQRQQGSRITVLASLGIRLGMFGLAAVVIVLARYFAALWLAAPVFLLLGAVGVAVYLGVLQRLDQAAMKRREFLIAEVSKV